jgi:type II secretory pathway component GspD/PulD (secretin)
MSTRKRSILWLLPFAVSLAVPVRAQDTLAVRVTESGILVDFQDTDIRIDITSLAEAGGLNVSFADLPAKRVTLRLRSPIPRNQVATTLKSLAVTYDLAVTDDGGILRFAALPRDTRPASGRDVSAADEQLFIYRLKHARAAILAPTLEHVFGARGGVVAPALGLTQVPLSQRLRDQQLPPASADQSSRNATISTQLPAASGVALPGRVRGEVLIMADESTNSLLVRAQSADWVIVRQAIDAMDLRPLQTLIEVVIAEVTQTGDLEFGVSASASVTTRSGTATGNLTNSAASDFVAQFTRTAGGFSMDVAINALASRGHVRILSRPIILAQNNKEARILVGSQRPFIQVSQSVPTNVSVLQQVVQYRDVGTSLSILPTINPDGYVNLQVSQEVSTATAETQFGAPVISTREISTQVFVKDGQTAVLGGLVDREQTNSRSGIPLLSSLPGIGALFGSTSVVTTTSELFLFLTPHIIARDEDVDRLREAMKQGSADETGLERPVSTSILPPSSSVKSPSESPSEKMRRLADDTVTISGRPKRPG